ncbi:unnamed protein product, partial [Meganyctiphanes norvegica]
VLLSEPGGLLEKLILSGSRQILVEVEDPVASLLLQKISSFRQFSDDHDVLTWFFLSPTKRQVIEAYHPVSEHRIYFSKYEYGSNTSGSTVEVLVKVPDYSVGLVPSAVLPSPKISPGEKIVAMYTWKPNTDLQALSVSSLYNLGGLHLKVVTIRGAPFMNVHFENNDDNQRKQKNLRSCQQPTNYTGFLKDILDIMAQHLNFTYELYVVCDGAYGGEVNGTWTGIVGEVYYGRAHLGLANLANTEPRQQVVAFATTATSYGGAG